MSTITIKGEPESPPHDHTLVTKCAETSARIEAVQHAWQRETSVCLVNLRKIAEAYTKIIDEIVDEGKDDMERIGEISQALGGSTKRKRGTLDDIVSANRKSSRKCLSLVNSCFKTLSSTTTTTQTALSRIKEDLYRVFVAEQLPKMRQQRLTRSTIVSSACHICTREHVHMAVIDCPCTEQNTCVDCTFTLYAEQSDFGLKSFARCPFCSHEFSLSRDVAIPSTYVSP